MRTRKTREEIIKENKDFIERMFFSIIFVLVILLLVVVSENNGNYSKQVRCKEINGHWCNQYQLERMEEINENN